MKKIDIKNIPPNKCWNCSRTFKHFEPVAFWGTPCQAFIACLNCTEVMEEKKHLCFGVGEFVDATKTCQEELTKRFKSIAKKLEKASGKKPEQMLVGIGSEKPKDNPNLH